MSRIIIGLIGATCCIFTIGCKTAPNTVLSFCSGTEIAGTCLVKCYGEDSSVYVTENQHRFCPETVTLEINSEEPQGKNTWLLQGSNYLQKVKSKSDKEELFSKEIMQALLFSIASSTELPTKLDLENLDPVKVEGKWYNLFRTQLNTATIELFQNKFTQRYELITVKNGDVYLQAYSYDLWYDKNLGRQIPRSVDVFDLSTGFASKKLIRKFSYISIGSVGQ